MDKADHFQDDSLGKNLDLTLQLYRLHHGDCLDVLKTLENDSVDSVVCDPPYGLSNHTQEDMFACLRAWLNGETYRPAKGGFMGKAWDAWVPGPEIWREVLRVLKPGGHLLCFGGSRTVDLMGIALRLAGFEVRDVIMYLWVYGSGFPKSHNISIAIDKLAGAEREVVGNGKARACWAHKDGDSWFRNDTGEEISPDVFSTKITAPATPAAAQWDGWGTALKPAHEPIICARKPLQGTVAENVLQWGTGGINVDGCRVGTGDDKGVWPITQRRHQDVAWTVQPTETDLSKGRWPANIIHDGSAEVVAGFPYAHPTYKNAGMAAAQLARRNIPDSIGVTSFPSRKAVSTLYAEEGGSAARFFYCAKASKADRDEGLEGVDVERVRANIKMGVRECNVCGSRRNDKIPYDTWPSCGHDDWKWAEVSQDGSRGGLSRNHHPTVKPTALMRYLCKLVTPPGGIVLDPFMGSGSTGKAAVLEGFRFIGIEREAEYLEIARARIHHAAGMPAGGDDAAESDVGNAVDSDVRTTRELSVHQNPPIQSKISRIRPIQARLL